MTNNNKVIAASSENQWMPVATITPILIAIEYANQVTKGFVDPNKSVSLADVELYHIPHVDQGAHHAWVEKCRQKKRKTMYSDNVQLHDVVEGMLYHQSHANTAFLLNLLNINQLNQQLAHLHLDHHEDFFYFTAAPLLPAYLHVEESLSTRKIKQKLQEMPQQDFNAYCGIIHGLLTHRSAGRLIEQHAQMNMDEDIKQLITHKLPRSTTEEYANILNKLYYEKEFDEHKEVLTGMTASGYWTYIGDGKTSTSRTNNHVIHGAPTDENNHYVLCVFMNNVTTSESSWINENIEDFLAKTLTDNTFQEEVIATLST